MAFGVASITDMLIWHFMCSKVFLAWWNQWEGTFEAGFACAALAGGFVYELTGSPKQLVRKRLP